jgi:hypothetical protein
MSQTPFVPREREATALSNLLIPDPLFGEIAGLFLAAPRRTGKSTFLRRDLTPILEAQGKMVIYIDLWSDKTTDPSELIKNGIRQTLEDNDGPIARFRKNVPFTAVGGLGFRVDLKTAGQWEGTIPGALSLLVQSTGKDIVLMIDEAQQSLESTEGMNAMFALKAARDEVNQTPDGGHLYLVMTGSHRDKLATLVSDHKAPFFGASVRDLPPLGVEYPKMLSEHLAGRMSEEAQLSADELERAFDLLGRRPEVLNRCLRQLLLAPEFSASELMAIAQSEVDRSREQLLSEIEALPKMQQDMLRLMARDASDFAPFSQGVRDALGKEGKPAGTSSLQKAINALRDKGYIWRPRNGVYLLNDSEIAYVLRREGARGDRG